MTIGAIDALEILDSRGRPTLEVGVQLSDGTVASAQVPSGASTGRHEALELRDHDPDRYKGYGVRTAAHLVNTEIASAVRGMRADALPEVEARLLALDGTGNKSRLGANSMLGVSCAVARALAVSRREPLWRTLSGIFQPGSQPSVPRPMVNILSGGHHAAHNIEIQDFLAIPLRFTRYADALEAVTRVHAAAREILSERGIAVTGVADEGGWGPILPSNEAALDVLTEAIERAGEDCAIAIDVASSHFYADSKYHLRTEERILSAAEMIDLLDDWRRKYPVISLEDALDQDDWAGWKQLQSRLGSELQLIGDDLFTTNPARVRRGVDEHAANAVLVKMNQIGSLTETFEVVRLCASAEWKAVISARSGETEDSFLADLAAATGAGQIKIGSITRSERLAKYNRLLRIEASEGLSYSP